MAKKKSDFGAIVTGIVASVTTVGLGALAIDWMKAKGYWVKSSPVAGEMGCDACVGEESDDDPLVKAADSL